MILSLRKVIPVRFIVICITIMIAVLYTGSSVIYAKKDPNSVFNTPHKFNKFICGTRSDHTLHSKAVVRNAVNVNRLAKVQFTPAISADFKEGDVMVMVDDGTLLSQPAANPVDLDGLTLLFTPNGSGGYGITSVSFVFDTNLGTDVEAGDDTNHLLSFTGGFSFPYFGTSWTNIFVRSNGNVTFGAFGNPDFFDPADLFLELPIIAAFFGDLDPSAGGAVFAKEEATKFTVTWDAVPEFDVSNLNTVQLVLNDDGSFQVTYNGLGIIEPDNGNLYVGYNSGRAAATLLEVDISALPIDGGNTDILFEWFKSRPQFPIVNEIALFNKFYETHDDIFDQVVLFTNFTSDIATFAGAFNLGIRNSVEGINRSIYDNTSDYGSAGRLKSYLNMNELNIWPEDPAQRNSPFGDNNNFLTIMGQEAGHLWNSFLRFDKGDGPSDLLLGRALAHWSSFTGFEVTSTMGGGNNWIELSPGIFEVDAIIDYYSNLDQYAIGLRAPEEVPPFFYISSLSNNNLANRSQDTFIPGTEARGTRVEVTIEDIIAAEGPRIPSRDSAQKDYQQAFILLVKQGTDPSPNDIDKVQRYIDAWKDYWIAATDGRSTMSANLDAVLDVAGVEGIIADAVTSQPVDKLIIENLTTGVTQTVAAGGYYSWRTLSDSLGEPDGSFTHVIIGYPFIPDTLVIPTNFGITNTHNINLTRLPSGTLTGTVRVSKSGAPVEARIVVHIFNKLAGFLDVEVSTDNAGVYTFPELYASVPGKNRYDGVTVYPDFPGVKKEFDGFTIDAGVNHTLDFEVNPIDLLVVNDDPDGNYGNYYKTALNNLNVKYHHWVNAERGIAPVLAAATETVYPIIIWYTGNDAINSINIEEEAKLIEFLDAGGRLFLTGQNIVENLPETSVLLTDYLRVSHGGNSSVLSLIEVSNNPVTLGDASYTITGSLGADNQTSADIFIPTGPVFDVMTYGVKNPDLGAVAVETETFKIFLTGFGFEAINASTSSLTSPTQLMLRVLNWFGASVVISVEDEIISSLPKEFSLSQNYPNPFNPSTSISYSISQNATIKLTIYNVLGQKVFTLVDEQKSSGAYTVKWDGRNAAGSRVASGLYFYRLEAKHEVNGRQRVFVDANKMLLLQ